MVRAILRGEVIAESDRTVVVEGNHYFPKEDVNSKLLQESKTTTQCHWKGEASYYHVVVDGVVEKDAAWFYKTPLPEAKMVDQRVAFWGAVRVQ